MHSDTIPSQFIRPKLTASNSVPTVQRLKKKSEFEQGYQGDQNFGLTTIQHDHQHTQSNQFKNPIKQLQITELVSSQAIANNLLINTPKQIQLTPQELSQIRVRSEHNVSQGRMNQSKISHAAIPHEGYNPLKIPADWEIAKKHALARRVAKEKIRLTSQEGETCACCGYEIDREEIPFFADVMELGFLGSGFPLFYNFIVYCMLLLFEMMTINGGYNLVTNIMGDYCTQTFSIKVPEEKRCPNTWIHQSSLSNKLKSDHIQIENQTYLGLVLQFVIMVTLVLFRRSQKEIDVQIDSAITSPADYTICVKNIPKQLEVDYVKELKRIFNETSVSDSETPIEVTKVVLVHDIEEILELEKDLDKIIKQKQYKLHDNFCNFQDPSLKHYDEKIEEVEHKIHQIEHKLSKNNEKFTGIAFISFQTENMKNQVIENNPWSTIERIRCFFNNGKLPGMDPSTLQWNDHKLFIEQAPEPNDVDWEFIHFSTKDKIKRRIISYTLASCFMGVCFTLLYMISFWKAKLTDQAAEEAKEGKMDHSTLMKINILSFIISWTIVLFNKFVIGKVLHYIVDLELISNKTKFNISYAQKLSISLFLNTAVISYIIDIVILNNIIGHGGFIQNETQVFILNALFPPLVWLIDPWTIQRDILLHSELQQKNLSVVTQQQANKLAEYPDYLQSKRYSDIMKTMWFTFLYGNAIPLGVLFSMIGLSIYYYVDKYNVLRRRTIKESLAKDLSIEMIEMLELVIFFNAVGNITMTQQLLGVIKWQDLVILIASIVYMLLPMQELTEKYLPVEEINEQTTYDEAFIDFDTDYDRENPVTKKEAFQIWKDEALKRKKITGKDPDHQVFHQLLNESREEGSKQFNVKQQ